MEIPEKILLEFYHYIDRFVSVSLPDMERLLPIDLKNEEKCFHSSMVMVGWKI